MNRIALRDITTTETDAIRGLSGSLPGCHATKTQFHFESFVPLHYERNYAYPLIVWLHHSGDKEEDLRTVMPSVSLRNYVAVAPRATRALPGVGNLFVWDQTPSGIEQAWGCILHCIRRIEARYHISSRHVFVAGHL